MTMCCRKEDLSKYNEDCFNPKVESKFEDIYNNTYFQRFSRSFNNDLSLSGLSISGPKVHIPGNRKKSCASIHGRTRHIVWDADRKSSPLNWLLYDRNTLFKSHYKKEFHTKEYKSMLNSLQDYLLQHNLVYKELEDFAKNTDQMFLVFKVDIGGDILAALEKDIDVEKNSPRVLVFRKKKSNQSWFMNSSNPLYETIRYPLFFLKGQKGWGSYMNENSRIDPITLQRYLQYNIIHNDTMHKLGPLYQEYTLDSASRLEDMNLSFFRHIQKSRIHCTESNLNQYIQDKASNPDNSNLTPTIISNSFQYGPGAKRKFVSDCLHIFARKGKPNYFITYTFNPEDKAVTDYLLEGQTWCDRFDLVVRAFDIRKRELIEYIKEGVFGKVVYIIYAVEFQRTGLPHMHLLLKVKNPPETALEVDEFISAEIPDEHDDPEYYRLSTTLMRHTHTKKCGPSWNRTCGYPKPPVPESYFDHKGYCIYKRNAGDNSIVPHNKKLLMFMKSHVNVEWAASVSSAAYLVKYLSKGSEIRQAKLDRIKKGENRDEKGHVIDQIQEYIDFRIMSAPEAAYKILPLTSLYKSIPVKEISICIEGNNLLSLNRKEVEHLQSIKDVRRTPVLLKMYYLRPDVFKEEVLANLLIEEFFERYTFVKEKPKKDGIHFIPFIYEDTDTMYYWKERQSLSLFRLKTLLPSHGEVYYLRMILKYFAVSSEIDAKSFETVQYNTFEESAKARGLVSDNDENVLCMREAVKENDDCSLLTSLYIKLILNGAPTHSLFNEFKHILLRDFYVDKFKDEKLATTSFFCICNKVSHYA